MEDAYLSDAILEEPVTITLSRKAWRSILGGEYSDLMGFDDGVAETIKSALCPTDDDHYIQKWTSPIKEVKVWNLHCVLCGEGWWNDGTESD